MMARQLGCGQVHPSWIPQSQRENQRKPASQKSLWISMQSNCLYLALCTNINSSSLFYFLVARIPWSHLQWDSTLFLPWANASLPANFRGNALNFFSQACPSLLIMILCHFLQNTVPAPQTRTTSYNAAGPISALGFKSTTFAQLMSRYATSDPNLISSASDKRKAPSLVAIPVSHPVLKAKPNALITCEPGSSYTHA
jgi:hypothetical protein